MATLSLTPTMNTVLPFKTSGFTDLLTGLEYAAQGNTGFNFYNAQAELEQVLSYTELLEQSLKVADCLLAMGLKQGDHLPVIAETRAEFLIVFYACQYIGIIISPFPMFASIAERETFAEKTLHRVSLTNAKFVVASSSLISAFFANTLTDLSFISFEELVKEAQTHMPVTDSIKFSFTRDNHVAFMQFSSGSTSKPKGIRIYNHDVCEHARIVLEDVMKLRADDRSLSWLPFYHNMGLIGFIIASVNGQRSVDCFSPFTFIGNPSLWLRLISSNKTAITYAPMFAYQLAVKAYLDSPTDGLDLSSLRVAGIGGDAIRSEVMDSFSQVFASRGFNYNTFLPSYGMTEAILAISGKKAGEPVVTDKFEDKVLISCGKALSGYQLQIRNAAEVSGRLIGDIYFHNIASTDTLFGSLDRLNGFVDTGDIGYIHEDNLFILGRQKEVVLIRGRNIWVDDIKIAILAGNKNLIADNVIVTSIEVDQEEKLVVMIQTNEPVALQLKIEKKSKQLISQQFNVAVDIVFVGLEDSVLNPSGKVVSDRFIELYNKAKNDEC